MEQFEDKLFELSRGLVEGMGFTLVSVEEVREHGRRVFRFYIDSQNGVSLGDCEAVSRELAYLLDAEPELAERYVLEISSPGLDHRLKREREYVHFAGREARLVLRAPLGGSNVVKGTIVGAEGGIVRVAPQEGEVVSIPFEDIARARLVI